MRGAGSSKSGGQRKEKKALGSFERRMADRKKSFLYPSGGTDKCTSYKVARKEVGGPSS